MSIVRDPLSVVGGSWFVVRGSWFVVRGSWFVVRGSWFVVRGSWFVVRGSWFVVRGSWFVVRGSWFVVRGSWFVVRGSWFVVRGSWFVVDYATYLRSEWLLRIPGRPTRTPLKGKEDLATLPVATGHGPRATGHGSRMSAECRYSIATGRVHPPARSQPTCLRAPSTLPPSRSPRDTGHWSGNAVFPNNNETETHDTRHARQQVSACPPYESAAGGNRAPSTRWLPVGQPSGSGLPRLSLGPRLRSRYLRDRIKYHIEGPAATRLLPESGCMIWTARW